MLSVGVEANSPNGEAARSAYTGDAAQCRARCRGRRQDREGSSRPPFHERRDGASALSGKPHGQAERLRGTRDAVQRVEPSSGIRDWNLDEARPDACRWLRVGTSRWRARRYGTRRGRGEGQIAARNVASAICSDEVEVVRGCGRQARELGGDHHECGPRSRILRRRRRSVIRARAVVEGEGRVRSVRIEHRIEGDRGRARRYGHNGAERWRRNSLERSSRWRCLAGNEDIRSDK